jgi:hypothetical protein
VSGDAVRPRLQLALGAAAVLAEELPSVEGRRVFQATDGAMSPSVGAAALRVVLHPLPPYGPDPAALANHVARLRELAHPVLVPPIAVGDFEGHAWLVEPAPYAQTARARLSSAGLLPIRDGIRILRDLARALAVMHRRGLAHGAVTAESVWLTTPETRLASLGVSVSGTPRDDLDALARTTWALLAGDAAATPGVLLSRHRRGVPAELDSLLAAMLAAAPDRRPQRAEVILDVLDALPAPRPPGLGRLFEGAGSGVRPRRTGLLLIALLAAGLLILLWVLSHRT